MFNITTKYVKIGDERKKVFMVRGDEAYTKTTDTTVSFDPSTIVTGDIKGFKIPTITVNILRNIGSSKLFLYDGDEIIGESNITNSAHSITFSNTYLAYNVDHNLYAVFKGNDACLGSKSKKIPITVDLPSSFKTNVAFTSPTSQINQGGNVSLNITVKQNQTNVADGTVVDVYLDDELVSSPTTTSGVATYTINNIPKGLHTITATVERTPTLNRGTLTYNLSSGYDVSIIEYPTPCIGGDVSIIKARVKDWFGNPVTSGTVTLSNSSTGTLNSSGTATISAIITTGGEYTATYSGTTSSPVTLTVFTPTSITVSPSTTVTARNQTLNVPIHVSGTGSSNGAEIIVGIDSQYSYCTLDNEGNTTYIYRGTNRGEFTLNTTIGDISKNTTLYDYDVYWTPTLKYNFGVLIGNVTEGSNGLALSYKSSSNRVMFSHSSDCNNIEFDVAGLTSSSTLTIGSGSVLFSIALQINDHIKLVRSDNTLKAYKNGTLVESESYSNSNPLVWDTYVLNPVGKVSIWINNLKIY